MCIYAELLFIENFITGAVILMLTAKISGKSAGALRITAGAIMCGLYAFILFVPLHWIAALVSKLLFSVIVIMIVFSRMTFWGLMKITGVFYIVSFLMGGITIALMYMLKIQGMTGNGSFILDGATFIQIAAGVTATWYLGGWLSRMLREKNARSKVLHEVVIELCGHCWQMQGLADTGNSLRDPVTGWPVAVLSKSMSEKIQNESDSEHHAKIYAIPYRTVDRASVMFGLRPDKVTIDNKLIKNIIVAFSERDFAPWHGTEKYDLLLHQQFLEGEDITNGQKFDDDIGDVGKTCRMAAVYPES